MIFNSAEYLIFFIIVFFAYWIIPHRLRWVLLLVSSCWFYMCWKAEFIVLIIAEALSNYLCGLYLEKNEKHRKTVLAVSLVFSFSILFVFKYLVFVNDTIRSVFPNYNVYINIVLPMGISFYTFQATSYSIDIYRKAYKAERNFFKFLLYIVFFPQLVAGPIERADRLLSQFFVRKKFDICTFSEGMRFIIMGFFKKIVIADRLAVLVNTVYNDVYYYKGLPLIIATLCFTVQIYCDFSGYSDIAIGTAKTLGINLMQNFDRPYFSVSVSDFWRRWHISLSSWLRDYVYIPLGGNRKGTARKCINLMITFFASGIWHGASFTYILWGIIHGFYQVVGVVKKRFFKLSIPIVNIIITFCLVSFAWIFFRANTISDSVYIVKNLFADIDKINDIEYLYTVINTMGLKMFELAIALAAVLVLFLYEIMYKIIEKFTITRFCFYYLLTAFIILAGVFGNGGEFIYFQF